MTGIYRSGDSAISTSDTRIGTDSNASLSANTGRTRPSPSIQLGGCRDHYIGAIADYSNAISESNESNNPSSGVWLTVMAQHPFCFPILTCRTRAVISAIAFSASSVVAGGSVTLTYRLSNFGTGSAPSSVTGIYGSGDSAISTSDTRIGTNSNASLSANTGRTETFAIDTTGWAAGTYYIGAIADYSNAISKIQ